MTKVRYFVDTGATDRVLSANSNLQLHEAGFNIQAVFGKPIDTYSKRCRRCFYLNRCYWSAIIQQSAYGHAHMVVIDANTKLSVSGTPFSGFRLCPVTVKHNLKSYTQRVLGEHPGLCETPPNLLCVSSSFARHIMTTGPYIFSKECRLAPEKSRLSKSELKCRVDLGIVRLLNNLGPFFLNTIPKKNSNGWSPSSDYRLLNT